jgi:hypothetical protein
VTHAPGTLHKHTIDGLSIESPLLLLPVRNTIHFPTIHPDEIIVFYITVKNPYNVPVRFSLEGKNSVRDESRLSMKSMHGGKVIDDEVPRYSCICTLYISVYIYEHK